MVRCDVRFALSFVPFYMQLLRSLSAANPYKTLNSFHLGIAFLAEKISPFLENDDDSIDDNGCPPCMVSYIRTYSNRCQHSDMSRFTF